MAEVYFTHPLITDAQHRLVPLNISVKPDQVTWAYGLNTAVYPTYGGEVVQILSVYFDDMTIAGTVSTVKELENIYGWFLTYMQNATQGRDRPSYDQQPVSFYYPERHWHFQIWPKSLPAFQYGRDIVAPTWTLTAAVKEPDATFAEQIKGYAAFQATTGKALEGEGFSSFGTATAEFGTTADLIHNPFASPDADPGRKGETVVQFLSGEAQTLGDTFDGFVQDFQNGNLSSLPQFASGAPSRAATPSPTRAATSPASQQSTTQIDATQSDPASRISVGAGKQRVGANALSNAGHGELS